MLRLLRERYEVETYLVDKSESDPYRNITAYTGDYEVLVCWQLMPPVHLLRKHISYKHAVLFPMADNCPKISQFGKWYGFRNFQIICFSRALHQPLKQEGFSSHYFQFFPAPNPASDPGDEESAFFWTRGRRITCATVERLSQSSFLKKIHIHSAPDPKVVPSRPDKDSQLSYTFSTWFENKQDLSETISKSSCYIAPRIREGIGMSFLEAMAMGRCVIAPNTTTMNEYIQHGVNGLLYDPEHPSSLPMLDVRKMQRHAAETIRSGHEQWNSRIPELMSLLEKKPEAAFLRLALKNLKLKIRRKLNS